MRWADLSAYHSQRINIEIVSIAILTLVAVTTDSFIKSKNYIKYSLGHKCSFFYLGMSRSKSYQCKNGNRNYLNIILCTFNIWSIIAAHSLNKTLKKINIISALFDSNVF